MTALRLLAALAALTAVSATHAEDAKTTLKVGEFTFKATPGWTLKATPRTMSKGGFTFKSDKEGTKPVDADLYHFGGGQGGSVEANVQRWKAQFKETTETGSEELKFGDRTATFLRVKGTYLDGRPFGPKTERPGYALLGAILPSEAGTVFIKATGPEASISAATEAFTKLIKSAYGE